MKRAEEAIERVLAGLREVEAAPGLEERIERRVREAILDRTLGRRDFGVSWRVGGAGLAACGAMLAIGVWTMHRRGEVAPVASGRQDSEKTRTDERGVEGTRPETLAAAHTSGGRARVGVRRQAGSDRAGDAGSSGLREEGWDQATRVSFPAPPMPLTEQERLLLRVIHHGDPEEVAMLDPAMQAVQDGEETAAFQEFFGKPEPVTQTIQQVDQGASR